MCGFSTNVSCSISETSESELESIDSKSLDDSESLVDSESDDSESTFDSFCGVGVGNVGVCHGYSRHF